MCAGEKPACGVAAFSPLPSALGIGEKRNLGCTLSRRGMRYEIPPEIAFLLVFIEVGS